MNEQDIVATLDALGAAARAAAARMAAAPRAMRDAALRALAARLREAGPELEAANAQDLRAASERGLAGPLLDRLRLDAHALATVIEGCLQLAEMPDPIGEITGVSQRPSGIRVGRMRVPLGVFGMIYESRSQRHHRGRPLAIKSGNACILRGGSEAIHSNIALWRCVQRALADAGLPETAVQLVETTDRAAVGRLVAMPEFVDVIIPRGGRGLIERVAREARVPVIKHLDGNCHTYVDERVDLELAVRVTDNAKTQKYSPCNATESLLVHAAQAAAFLPRMARCSRPRASRCAATSGARRCSRTWRAPGSCRRPTATGARNTSRPSQHPSGRFGRRGDRPHQPPRLASHRRDRHHRPPDASASCARSIRPASWSTPAPALPTASNMAWARRSASPPTSSTPAARWASKD